jgi:hypothetical protein
METISPQAEKTTDALDAELHARSTVPIAQNGLVVLNVGGQMYHASIATLRSKPGTLLDLMFSGRYDLIFSDDGSVFIDRDGQWFQYVLDYLRDGVMNARGKDALRHVQKEFEYFLIDVYVEREVVATWGVGIRQSQIYHPLYPEWITWDPRKTLLKDFAMCTSSADIYFVGGYAPGPSDVEGFVPGHRYVGTVTKFCAQTDQWTEIAPLSAPRFAHRCVVVHGILYVLGGRDLGGRILRTVEQYDIATGLWSFGPPLPTARASMMVVAVGDHIYVLGGRGDLVDGEGPYQGTPAAVWAFDTTSQTWAEVATWARPWEGATAAVLNGSIYITGGYGDRGVENTVLLFNPDTHAWITCNPMRFQRRGHTLFVVKGMLYAMCGRGDYGVILECMERYDLGQNEWTVLPGLVFECASVSVCPIQFDLFDDLLSQESGAPRRKRLLYTSIGGGNKRPRIT